MGSDPFFSKHPLGKGGVVPTLQELEPPMKLTGGKHPTSSIKPYGFPAMGVPPKFIAWDGFGFRGKSQSKKTDDNVAGVARHDETETTTSTLNHR